MASSAPTGSFDTHNGQYLQQDRLPDMITANRSALHHVLISRARVALRINTERGPLFSPFH